MICHVAQINWHGQKSTVVFVLIYSITIPFSYHIIPLIKFDMTLNNFLSIACFDWIDWKL
jgi:hypothetical protein